MFYIGVWGWISFLGATEITSIASAIPVIEETVVTWLWGGFFVDNATNMCAKYNFGENLWDSLIQFTNILVLCTFVPRAL